MNNISLADGSGRMFDRIAPRYDLLNRIISLGVDQGWRRRAVKRLALRPDACVLDLATGTADLAVMIAKDPMKPHVVGVDPSTQMLAVGRNKVHRHKLDQRVVLQAGDAQRLPFEAEHFDAVTIAFGIRNVPDRSKALREMSRVCKPDGRVAILELTEPDSGVMGALARWHIHKVVPFIGGLISGDAEYAYLQRSIAAFPKAEAFAAIMADSDLEVLSVEPLSFGAATLFTARPK